MNNNEAFSRVKIDSQLTDVGWNLTDGISVKFEHFLPDGTKADYVLANRHGHSLAVVEAKKASINPVEAEAQAKGYAEQLGVPFIFLANGEEVWLWEWEKEAHPRQVKTFFSQTDLETRSASKKLRVDPFTIDIDEKIAGRDYQKDCINTLCEQINVFQVNNGKPLRLFKTSGRMMWAGGRFPLANRDLILEPLTGVMEFGLDWLCGQVFLLTTPSH